MKSTLPSKTRTLAKKSTRDRGPSFYGLRSFLFLSSHNFFTFETCVQLYLVKSICARITMNGVRTLQNDEVHSVYLSVMPWFVVIGHRRTGSCDTSKFYLIFQHYFPLMFLMKKFQKFLERRTGCARTRWSRTRCARTAVQFFRGAPMPALYAVVKKKDKRKKKRYNQKRQKSGLVKRRSEV